MSKIKNLLILFLCVAVMLMSLTACDKPTEETVKYTVSFNTDGGSSVASQTVNAGEYATKPDAPTKEGKLFGDWYKEDLETVFVFDAEKIDKDTTVYAKWIDASTASTVTFYWNYDGAPNSVYETKAFEDNTRFSAPTAPSRGTGYYFVGWFTADGTAFSAMKKYTGDQSFYAKWQTIFTFEAEKTQLTGLDPEEDDTADDRGNKKGHNYSGETSGTGLIGGANCGASNDAYVTYLYYNGAYLQFEIESDAAVTDAVLRISLSCEFCDVTINDETFLVTVNGTDCKYGEIKLTGGSLEDLTSVTRAQFKEFYIGNISLKAGQNIIRLTVNNSDKQFATGTVNAAAPMIDYIRIYSSTSLSMTQYENK